MCGGWRVGTAWTSNAGDVGRAERLVCRGRLRCADAPTRAGGEVEFAQCNLGTKGRAHAGRGRRSACISRCLRANETWMVGNSRIAFSNSHQDEIEIASGSRSTSTRSRDADFRSGRRAVPAGQPRLTPSTTQMSGGKSTNPLHPGQSPALAAPLDDAGFFQQYQVGDDAPAGAGPPSTRPVVAASAGGR
jgi:hypothetical protein